MAFLTLLEGLKGPYQLKGGGKRGAGEVGRTRCGRQANTTPGIVIEEEQGPRPWRIQESCTAIYILHRC